MSTVKGELRRVRTAGALFSASPGLLVGYATEPPEPEGIETMRGLHKELMARDPSGHCYVIFVGERSTPSPEVRKQMTAAFEEMVAAGCRVAIVLEASGFIAAVQRSIGTTFLRMLGNKGMRVCGDAGQAALWLTETHIGGFRDPQALEKVLLDFRTSSD